jgi:hypothetical protein
VPEAGRLYSRAAPALHVSRPFPSWNRSILTEIYLCHACSCQEIVRTETAGQASWPHGLRVTASNGNDARAHWAWASRGEANFRWQGAQLTAAQGGLRASGEAAKEGVALRPGEKYHLHHISTIMIRNLIRSTGICLCFAMPTLIVNLMGRSRYGGVAVATAQVGALSGPASP